MGGKTKTCIADNCGADVLQTTVRPMRICPEHRAAYSFTKDGKLFRFCQQCSRPHELYRFNGARRGCEARLSYLRQRRNATKKRKVEARPAGSCPKTIRPAEAAHVQPATETKQLPPPREQSEETHPADPDHCDAAPPMQQAGDLMRHTGPFVSSAVADWRGSPTRRPLSSQPDDCQTLLDATPATPTPWEAPPIPFRNVERPVAATKMATWNDCLPSLATQDSSQASYDVVGGPLRRPPSWSNTHRPLQRIAESPYCLGGAAARDLADKQWATLWDECSAAGMMGTLAGPDTTDYCAGGRGHQFTTNLSEYLRPPPITNMLGAGWVKAYPVCDLTPY